MPAVQYPFIDIAVHPRIRERFSRGEAMVLFSTGLDRVLWANGAGADLFGYAAIYDFLDQGAKPGDVSFRQIEATARQLAAVGDTRSFLIRMTSGFQRVVANAAVEMIRIQAGEEAILFSTPVASKPLETADSARRMLEGFDDPDTHMAVIGRDGDIIASSPRFGALGITPQTAKMLVIMAGAQPERMIKRPIPTGRGYLPAAVGKLSDIPALHLLFVVEMAIGHLDPVEEPASGFVSEEPVPVEAVAVALPAAEIVAQAEAAAETMPETVVNAVETTEAPITTNPSTDVIEAVAGIVDVEEVPEEIPTDEADVTEEIADYDPADVEALAVLDGATAEDIDAAALDAVEEAQADPHSAEAGLSEDEPTADVAEDAAALSDPEIAPETPVQPATIEPTAAETPMPVQAESEIARADGFAFKSNGRATRFVWKIDAEGRFSEISREFAEAVGPHAAKVTGAAFADIAALFKLDPEGKIAELLAKRDTWSGRTINWPIEGTSLMVPVDLAALPTYTRSREFDGFRGFGVVRLSDAIEDPMAMGLTLSPVVEEDEKAEEQSSLADAEPVVAEDISADILDEAPASLVPTYERDEPELPFSAEPPVLKIADTPNRRLSDKIIQLHEHRMTVGDGLSASEQAAFREIAKQLEPFGKRTEPAVSEQAGGLIGSEILAAFEEIPAEPGDDTAIAGEISDAPADDVDVIEATVPQTANNDNNHGGETTAPDTASAPEEDFNPLDVLNTVIPPRVKMTSGLSAEIVDQLPIAILVHAGDRLIHGNPELLRLTGYAGLSEIEGVGGLDALLQRHDLDGKTDRPGAMMVVRADDSLVPVTARLQSIRWEDNSALMLALMPIEKDDEPAELTEIAGREEVRPERMLEKVAKLQIEVEELRSILETATDGVVIIGPEGDIRSMNRSASALFNYDDQETRGKPFVMLFAHESQKAVLDYLSGLAGHGVASVLNDGREVIGREASGGFVPLFMTMGKLTSSNGYCAVIRDITQWKRTEEDLRNAKRAAETANAHKSDFLARVSHEIRTPLNAIIGFSDMMASERLGPIGHSRYVEYSNDIGRSGRHVLDIVNDLLDISKIEAGEMDLEFGAVGLNEAIAEAVSLVQPQANNQRVIIRTALSQSVPNVVADLRSIKQIALNILSNAIRFTPSGGQIVVSTSYEGNGSVVIRIRDTGVGMTRTELEQAMKPFRQVATNSRKRGDGTGLGLPLTKAMVDANRALFSINSAPNEGTLVEITFPSPRVLAN
ncbi:ATP-binding protein [Rhizobium tubonense]|uniref:histidine kinase n=1 Tax=Rhizobium tubonense TaxID=484088 RepID=A0A2W4CFP7_9HYPH|nr:ATP-binding protein [Rhizobium tubonense]PZM11949.1 PAS domain-containing sensor histidine kinase [Rhizobium tubonense]